MIDDQSDPGAWATHIAHTPHLSASAAAPADTRQWSWWAGRDGFDGELFTIVCATQDGPFDAAPFDSERLVEHVVDRFVEDNAERFGEDGFDGDIDLDALAATLNAAFRDFIDKHGGAIRTWSFTAQREKKEIRP